MFFGPGDSTMVRVRLGKWASKKSYGNSVGTVNKVCGYCGGLAGASYRSIALVHALAEVWQSLAIFLC
jgi:hypothetical protein